MKRLSNLLTLSLLFSLAMPCFGMEKEPAHASTDKQEGSSIENEVHESTQNEESFQEPTQENIALAIENINKLKEYIQHSQIPEKVLTDREEINDIQDDIIRSLEIFEEVPEECIAYMQRLDRVIIEELINVAISLQSKEMILNLLSSLSNAGIYLNKEVLDKVIQEAVDCQAELSCKFLIEYIRAHSIGVNVKLILDFAWEIADKDLFENTLQTLNGHTAFIELVALDDGEIADFPSFFEDLSFENQHRLALDCLRFQLHAAEDDDNHNQ